MKAKYIATSVLAIAGAVIAGVTAHADQMTSAPPPSVSSAPSPEQQRAALNRAEANAAAQQVSQDIANQQQHAVAMDVWRSDVAAYHEATRDQRAETAEQQRQYENALARWHADAVACKAGDASRCAPEPQNGSRAY